ncbi:MAG: hypothetical protein JKX69_05335 [Rhodobacteraceae bacterium]|nr:hypothetical protein [Paracoccaceae bacterium]
MAKGVHKWFEALMHRGSLRRWSRVARQAPGKELDQLRADRSRARALGQRLDEVIRVAETRLALPRIGSNVFAQPSGTDWSWRPQLWRGPFASKGLTLVESKTPLGDEVTIFHDCKISELTLRQLRNQREEDLAAYGLRMDVFRFDGSFLSLVVDLPQEACDGLKKRHLVRLATIVEFEKPLEIFARLNIRHGPNTEQIVRELPLGEAEVSVEFDLAYSRLNEKRVERMWVDLIFEGPEMNQITLRDLTFARYPRAEL